MISLLSLDYSSTFLNTLYKLNSVCYHRSLAYDYKRPIIITRKTYGKNNLLR